MQNYAFPPITEAVIEIRMNNNVDPDDLKKIAAKLNKDFYPDKKENIEINFSLEFNPISGNQSSQVKPKPTGYRLASTDQSDIAIIAPQSLTISRLPPYPGWEKFYERLASAWKVWKRVTKIQDINRIGIRYINRIDIPTVELKNINVADYLNFYANVPVFPENPMTEYFIQITKPTSNPLWTANIASFIHQPVLLGKTSLVLDVDIYSTDKLPLNDEQLMSRLFEARELKNQVFKQCITVKTEELFG
jgi:uncharacterized protein (TIGR04255 family)